jgi:hypothetical protein
MPRTSEQPTLNHARESTTIDRARESGSRLLSPDEVIAARLEAIGPGHPSSAKSGFLAYRERGLPRAAIQTGTLGTAAVVSNRRPIGRGVFEA